MRKITLDDCGQVMPLDYWDFLGDQVWAIMVIKAPSGQHLAITFPESNFGVDRPKDITPNQRRAIREFMCRNKVPKRLDNG